MSRALSWCCGCAISSLTRHNNRRQLRWANPKHHRRAIAYLPNKVVALRNARVAGFPLSASQRMADEPVDVWLKPYEQPSDTEAAMNAYLSWEVDLLERIKQDGSTRFVHAAARRNSHHGGA
jgi:hypothetical protein